MTIQIHNYKGQFWILDDATESEKNILAIANMELALKAIKEIRKQKANAHISAKTVVPVTFKFTDVLTYSEESADELIRIVERLGAVEISNDF